MKTIFDFVQFCLISHPAGGWFNSGSSGKRKRKALKNKSNFISPDSFNARGVFKKQENPRRNPMP